MVVLRDFLRFCLALRMSSWVGMCQSGVPNWTWFRFLSEDDWAEVLNLGPAVGVRSDVAKGRSVVLLRS